MEAFDWSGGKCSGKERDSGQEIITLGAFRLGPTFLLSLIRQLSSSISLFSEKEFSAFAAEVIVQSWVEAQKVRSVDPIKFSGYKETDPTSGSRVQKMVDLRVSSSLQGSRRHYYCATAAAARASLGLMLQSTHRNKFRSAPLFLSFPLRPLLSFFG